MEAPELSVAFLLEESVYLVKKDKFKIPCIMCNFYIIACSLATIHVQTWAKKVGFCWKGASIGENMVFKPDGLMKCNRIPSFLQ